MLEKRYGTLLKLSAPCLVYESYTEADTAAGKVNACLAEANDSGYYRGPANDVRDYICDIVEEATGVSRNMRDTGKKNDSGQPILAPDESEGEYCKRAAATKGWDMLPSGQYVAPTNIQEKLNEWAKTANEGQPLAVDFKVTERVAKERKLPEIYKATATKVLDNPNRAAAMAKVEQLFASTKTVVPTLTGDVAKDVELLGWSIKLHKDTQAKNELEQFQA